MKANSLVCAVDGNVVAVGSNTAVRGFRRRQMGQQKGTSLGPCHCSCVTLDVSPPSVSLSLLTCEMRLILSSSQRHYED